jgi:kinesin family protein 5
MAQEESELQAKRRTDVEKMLIKRETAYEELLDRTASNQSMAVEDIKVSNLPSTPAYIKVELQQRFTDQEERLKSDLAAHIEQVESKNAEVERLKGTIDEYKVSVEELNRALTAVSTGAGANDGQYLASTIQEYDRLRRNNEAQYHEFENIKRNLMADLSNRCEKVYCSLNTRMELTNRWWNWK